MFGMRRRTSEAHASSRPIASRCGAACPDAHTTSPMGVCGTPQLSPQEIHPLTCSPLPAPQPTSRWRPGGHFLTSCSCCALSVPHKPTTGGLISHGGRNLGGKRDIRGCQNIGGHGDCCPYRSTLLSPPPRHGEAGERSPQGGTGLRGGTESAVLGGIVPSLVSPDVSRCPSVRASTQGCPKPPGLGDTTTAPPGMRG